MNRVNDKGLQIIEYKTEMLKDYSKLIKNSMLIAVEQLAINGIIDADTHLAIKDDSISTEDFIAAIHDKQQFMKTIDELFEEFELLRKKLDNQLLVLGLDEEVKTKSVVQKDKIVVTKIFCIDREFIMEYFGVDEESAEKIMRKKQMVDKFTALRLAKIFRDFLNKEMNDLINVSLDVTAPYFYPDEEEDGTYNIDLLMEISVEKLEDENIISEVASEIFDIDKRANEFYMSKMMI